MSIEEVFSRIKLTDVLYATDFSQSAELALPYAVAVAQHFGGRLQIAHVISPEIYDHNPPEMIPSILKDLLAASDKQMQRVATSGVLGDVPHQTIVRDGEVWETLSSIAAEYQSDLIVVGTRGRRGIKKRILGSIAEEIYRLASMPVLTVGPRSTLSAPAKLGILYATDFSPESLYALPYAVSFAQEFGGLLTVLHVATGASAESDMRMRLGEFFTDELHALLPPESLPWARVDYQVKFGPAVEGILEAAHEHSAGLIVMGVRGVGSLQSATPRFGSTAQWVVSLANSPVLTVRRKIFTNERL